MSVVTSGVSMPPTMLTPRLAHPVYTSIVVTDSSSTGVDIIRHIRCFPATSLLHQRKPASLAITQSVHVASTKPDSANAFTSAEKIPAFDKINLLIHDRLVIYDTQ